MFWQVRCNDGGGHHFGQSDVPAEALCEVCRMSEREVRKRLACNAVLRLINKDPYTESGRAVVALVIKRVQLSLDTLKAIAEEQ